MAIDVDGAPVGVADPIRGDATAREERAAAARVALESVALPVGDLNEALPHLRRPFAPEAVKFKVQTVFGSPPNGCVIVSYIDARLVIERLNAVVGGHWSPAYRKTDDPKHMLCDLTVFDVTRPDVGQSSKGFSKDLVSDALKRSAVMFGVGVSIYAMAPVTMYLNDAKGRIKAKKINGKDSLVLTDQGHEWLRGAYRRWLETAGGAAFGPPLDHGDQLQETFDPEAEAALEGEGDSFTPAVAPALEDEAAVALIGKAREVYAAIAKLPGGAKQVKPAQFDQWLKQASHSHAELERLVDHLQQRYAEIGGA